MGYSHSWYLPPVIPKEVFQQIRTDFQKLILPLADRGVPLANWKGVNEPEIRAGLIRFNGVRRCGHPENEEISIPYPTEGARSVGPSHTAVVGSWYDIGVELRHRCCGGSCCCETFSLSHRASRHVLEGGVSTEPETEGLVYNSTKTAFRPYDIAVTAALLIAKRYLRQQLVIHSNGADAQWADAKELCQQHLGYGAWFGIVEEPRVDLVQEPDGTQSEDEWLARILVEIDPMRLSLEPGNGI